MTPTTGNSHLFFSETNTIAYLSSGKDKEETSSGRSQGSPHNSNDDFNTSDDEHLTKYVSLKVPENAEDSTSTSSDSDTIIMSEQEMPVDPDSDDMNVQQPQPSKKCTVGHPNGRTKPPAHDFKLPTSIQYKNIRRDHIDEECQRLGIFHKCWGPLNLQQTSHPSVRDFNDDTVIPDEQNIPEWCIMCP